MSRILKPSISYFVFCKNEEKRIERTIENILSQKIENLQLVVQDGGSKDRTLKILHKFKDHIDLKSEKDSGPGEAFWRAIKRCKNDYVGCLNCDEKLLPNAIQDNYNLLKSSKSDVIFRDSKLIDEKNNILGTAVGQEFNLAEYWENKFCPHFSTALFSRKALHEIGLHKFRWLETCGEFELWTRLAEWQKITYKPGVVSEYTLRKDQLSNNSENILKLAIGRAYAMYRHSLISNGGQRLERNISKKLQCSYSSFAQHSANLGHFDTETLLKSIGELEGHQNKFYDSINFHKRIFNLTSRKDFHINHCKSFIEKQKAQLKIINIKNNTDLIVKKCKTVKVYLRKSLCRETQRLQNKILKKRYKLINNEKICVFILRHKGITTEKISISDLLSFKVFYSNKLIFIEKEYFESNYDHNANCDPFFYIFHKSLCDSFTSPYIKLIDQTYNFGLKELKDITLNFLKVFKKTSLKIDEHPVVTLRKVIPTHVVYKNILGNIAIHNFIYIISLKLKEKLQEKIKKFCNIDYWQKKRKKTSFFPLFTFVKKKNIIERSCEKNSKRNISAVFNLIKSKHIRDGNILSEYSNKILELNHKQAAEIALNENSLFNRFNWEYAFQNELKNPAATNETLLKFGQIYNNKLYKNACSASSFTKLSPLRKKRKRVAFSCSFWAAPTCLYQVLPWLGSSVKWDCEIIGFGSYLPESNGKLFHEFHLTENMPSEFFVNYVRSLKIDIFIELTGLSPGNRHLEMISRLAPVQISYMNHTATTGVDNIDYLVADNNCIHENEYKYFSERMLMLQDCFFCFNYDQDTYTKRKTYPKKTNSIKFGVFGSYEKLNPELLRMYASLVKKVPDSKIIFKNTRLREQRAKNICKEILQNEGLNRKQFALEYGGNRENILNSYSAIDISLDTSPYNGGNTIAESLHMGTIPISLKGNRFSSRYGSSILQFANLEQYIAVDEVSFIQKAISLSNDKQKRKWAKMEMPFQLKETFFNKTKFGDNFFSCLSKI